MSFIVRRLIFYVVAAWVALTINFFIPRLMPGNAVESILAKFPNLQPSAYRALEAMLGVGHPRRSDRGDPRRRHRGLHVARTPPVSGGALRWLQRPRGLSPRR